MTNTVKVKAQAHKRAFTDVRKKFGLSALMLGDDQCKISAYIFIAIVNRKYVNA